MVLWRPRRCMWHAVLFGAAVVVITCVLTWNHLGTSVTRYMYSLNSTYITTQLNLRTELLSPINDSIENQMQETDIGVIKENTSQRTSTNLGNQSAKTEDRRSDVTQLHEYYNLNSSKPFKIRNIHRHIEPGGQFEIFTNQSKIEIGKASLHRIVEETSGNTEAKIVIILAYMHTGSTYTASIINNHPGTFYEFEPLRSLQKSSRESRWIQFLNGTTRRLSGEVINTHIGAEAVSNMITCNHDMLDITTLSKQYPLSITGGTSDFFICKNDTYKRSTNNIQGHKSKLNYLGLPQTNLSLNTYSQLGRWEKFYGEQNRLQLEQLQQLQTHLNGSEYSRGRHERSQVRHIGGVKSEVESCLPRLTSKCKNAHIRLTKFIRMTMGMTEELLTKFDNIRIIHLLRDPRAMMDSELRKNEMHVSSFPVFQSRTHYMCSRMQSDLIIADKLKRTFPGRIFTLRYEDLVDEPLHTGQRIFSFIKVPFTHLDEQFIVSKSIEVSKNSTYRANVWRHHISQKHLTVVNKYCSELSRRLGYISFKSVDDVRNLKLPDHFKYINTSSFNY